ncbi:MAG: hypothetical protein JNM86_01830 [Phycisphaerae bacterium]|nr:hypothetical protein [Phycisphaerae bacterium]
MLLGATARADDEEVVRRLSGYHFGDETWNYIPVHDPATGLVDAIVAIAKPDATIGDNLNTVMFIRSGNEFEAWSWRNATRGRAVYSAKMVLNVSDDDDANWLLEEELPWLDDDAIRPPVPYMAGMLTDDPLFEPVMESENPGALVDMLASMGYPVALLRPGSGGGETGSPPREGCAIDLLSFAGATEWALGEPLSDETTEWISQGMASMISTSCNGCTPGDPTGDPASQANSTTCTYEVIRRDPPVGANPAQCIRHIKKTFKESVTTWKWDNNCNKVPCTSTRTGYTTDGIETVCETLKSTCNDCKGPASGNFCGNGGPSAPDLDGPGRWTSWTPRCD